MATFVLGSIKNQGKRFTKIGVQKAKDGAIRAYRTKQFGLSVPDQDEIISRSILDTPVYDNLVFGDFEDANKNVFTYIDGTQGIYQSLRINDVLMTVSQTKNIIKTSIQGKNGTIKEYVNDGDYLITISGRITNTDIKNNDIYPEEEMFKLRLILGIPDTINITSGFLQGYGIFTVVIEDFNIPQQVGLRNYQLFDITMSSDTEIDLTTIPDVEA